MADSGDSPRSKLDFLYRDVLGEVTKLVERLEAVSAQLGEVAQARAGDATADALTRAAAASAARVRMEFERSGEIARRRLAEVADEAARAAPGLQGACWRDYVVWGAVYLGASILGGAVVALVLRMP